MLKSPAADPRDTPRLCGSGGGDAGGNSEDVFGPPTGERRSQKTTRMPRRAAVKASRRGRHTDIMHRAALITFSALIVTDMSSGFCSPATVQLNHCKKKQILARHTQTHRPTDEWCPLSLYVCTFCRYDFLFPPVLVLTYFSLQLQINNSYMIHRLSDKRWQYLVKDQNKSW